MTVVNGTAISAGMSGLACKVRQHKDVGSVVRVKLLDYNDHGGSIRITESNIHLCWLWCVFPNIKLDLSITV